MIQDAHSGGVEAIDSPPNDFQVCTDDICFLCSFIKLKTKLLKIHQDGTHAHDTMYGRMRCVCIEQGYVNCLHLIAVQINIQQVI